MSKNYQIVVRIEFIDGSEDFVIWQPEFYGFLLKRGVDIEHMLLEGVRNDFNTPSLNFHLELWENPQIQSISSTIGSNDLIRKVCIGNYIFPIITY